MRLGHIRSLLADAELRAGRSEQAERELRQAYAELARVGDRAGSITVALELADVLLDRSQDAGAAEWLAKSQDVLERSDVMTRVLGEGVRARLLARAGAASEADVLAKHAVELAESTDALNAHARAWLAFADVQRVAERTTDADEAVARAVALYELKGDTAGAAVLAGEASASPNRSRSSRSTALRPVGGT